MDKIKFGIKLWSTNRELIKTAKPHFIKKDFDYIELMAVKDSFNRKVLGSIGGIPVIIHCCNEGVNFAKEEMYSENIAAVREAQRFADFFDSPYIIAHPGFDGEIRHTKRILDEADDSRLCIENMPGKTYDLRFECVGRTYDELKKLNAKNYCLDFSHAIKSANTLGRDAFENIRELLKLNPSIFHISDGRTDSEVDEHLNIGEGGLDFRRIAGIINGKIINDEVSNKQQKGKTANERVAKKERFMTLETPKEGYREGDKEGYLRGYKGGHRGKCIREHTEGRLKGYKKRYLEDYKDRHRGGKSYPAYTAWENDIFNLKKVRGYFGC